MKLMLDTNVLVAVCAPGRHPDAKEWFRRLLLAPSAPELRPNTGMVSTLAIDAPHLMDFTVDAEGNLYLAELDGIRRVGTDGDVRMLAPVASGANTEKVDPDRTITEPRGIARTDTASVAGSISAIASPVHATASRVAPTATVRGSSHTGTRTASASEPSG